MMGIIVKGSQVAEDVKARMIRETARALARKGLQRASFSQILEASGAPRGSALRVEPEIAQENERVHVRPPEWRRDAVTPLPVRALLMKQLRSCGSSMSRLCARCCPEKRRHVSFRLTVAFLP